ncbi:WD40 domain containing protein [Trichuris trichiura]|uniref:WD40 domain containing protein n=1 Tax=Trichuris trichiura TaxID=36087 RepID=A0A077ZJP6_TRITR|nr:WD40 domain containing protein [Trichuris trichiura]
MKVCIPSAEFHKGVPILAVDFRRNCSSYKIATGAINFDLRIWELQISEAEESVSVKQCSNLKHHDSSVNIVRFSHSGKFLASGDSVGCVHVWTYAKRKSNDCEKAVALCGSEGIKVTADDELKWIVSKTLFCDVVPGHSLVKEVADLSWSASDDLLATTSMNGSVILWYRQTGLPCRAWQCGNAWGLGVSCHPSEQLVVVMVNKGSMSIFNAANVKNCVLKRCLLPTGVDHKLEKRTLFDNDSSKAFKMSPSFSPDGNILVVPNGKICEKENKAFRYASYIWQMPNLRTPCYILPSPERTISVRFCPVTFKLRNCKEESMVKLDYKFVFAILSESMVFVYDTEHMRPIGCIANYHSAPLTDVTFSDDGRFLVTSSMDGNLSFISLSKDELGISTDSACWTAFKEVIGKEKLANYRISSSNSMRSSVGADPSSSVLMNSDSDSSTDDENNFSEINPKQMKIAAGVKGIHSKSSSSECQTVERTGDSRTEQHRADHSHSQNVKVRRISLQPVEDG